MENGVFARKSKFIAHFELIETILKSIILIFDIIPILVTKF